MIFHRLHHTRVGAPFDFQDVYAMAVAAAAPGDHIVEVGSQGRSAAFMAREIKASGKRIVFDCLVLDAGQLPGFLRGIRRSGLVDFLNPIQMGSQEGSGLYMDRSLFLVFLAGGDGDFRRWYPKVRPGGMIAGEGHARAPARRAVNRYFCGREVRRGSSWVVNSR